MSITIVGGGNPSAPTFPVQRSVRLRSSASAYFNRTPASAPTLGTKFTYSAWVKLGSNTITAANGGALFEAGTTGDLFSTICFLNSTIQFIFRYQNPGVNPAYFVTTTQVFRDPSAWYHIVCMADTTQATAANRLSMYVNGVQVTAFSATNYPAQNAVTYFGTQSTPSYIGAGIQSGRGYFDGYMTEVNFIDGQALTPTSFGAYNNYGVWSPAKYTGTYGTNGFYLNFQDNSAATAAAMGKDSSGNGNNWTPNNISVTAGVTYDSMLDVPTLTSADNANFATLNPVYVIPSNTANTFTNGNLTFAPTQAEGTGTASAVSSMPLPTTGKWYWEITPSVVSTLSSTRSQVGIMARAQISYAPALNSDCFVYVPSGQKATGNVYTAYGNTYAANDVIGVAVDLDNGAIYFAKNGTWQNSGVPTSGAAKTGAAFTTLTGASEYFPAVGYWGTFNANFGQRPFTYTPPAGFKSLNTYNLPAPTIPNGAVQFDVKLYTGNGGQQTQTGLNFRPDLVWVKSRSGAYDNGLANSVTGVGKYLVSNSTAAEVTDATGSIIAFNSTGFGQGGSNPFGANAATYAAWCWKANGTPAVVNTSGSIPSTISANTTAGFSIVTYTGNGTSGATFGHGLGVAPRMVIIKDRTSGTNEWQVYHVSIGNTGTLFLNTTNSTFTNIVYWNNTSPTSTTVTLGSGVRANTNTNNYVAYCWAEIPGFSKFGSYTGNGSADGPFVYLGFRPRFILAKRTDTVSDWWLYDTSRNTYNVISTPLFADLSNAEGNNAVYNLDLLSNGFKWRTADTTMNGSGGTYIYAAFAENPFNYSLAR